MDVRYRDNEQGPVVALVLALIVLGVGSLFLTWKSIARQRALVENNLFLSGGSIARGVESNLMRIVRSMGRNRAVYPMFPTLSRDLFQELAASDDFRFIAILDQSGKVLVSSEPAEDMPDVDFSRIGDKVLDSGQTWHMMRSDDNRETLISGLLLRPVFAALLSEKNRNALPGEFPDLGSGRKGHMGHMGEHGNGRNMHEGNTVQGDNRAYLIIGLNADRHLQQFKQYRRAAMLQTGYVFLAAVFLWFLAFAYIRRREQSNRLVRLEQFQNRLLDNMPDGLINVGADGTILAANGSAKKLLAQPDGESDGNLVGRNWKDLPIGEPDPAEPAAGEYEWQQHEYHGRNLEILSVPFPEGDNSAPELGLRLVLIRDRTRIRRLEEDLNEARRLATIGSLAAGVAHEVRNPLSSLRGFAQFFAEKLKGQEPLNSYATTMVQEADRLNRVVTDLLYLARPRALAPVEVDLARVGDSLKKLMRFDMEHGNVEPHFDFEAPVVWADPDAIRQVLLNLTANSLDALNKKSGEKIINISSHTQDGGVWVCVQDNGTGMDEDISQQALEPFFTAKAKGTGLGLAIVHNIMRAHKGQISIDSSPDQGTTIRLYFPNAAQEELQA